MAQTMLDVCHGAKAAAAQPASTGCKTPVSLQKGHHMSALTQIIAAFLIFGLVSIVGIVTVLGIMAKKTKGKGETLLNRLGAKDA
jgi:hypothetical protein